MDILIVGVSAVGIIFLIVFAGLNYYIDILGKRLLQEETEKRYLNHLFILELIILSVSLYLNLSLSIYSALGDTLSFSKMMEHLTENGFFGLYSKGGIQYPPFFQYLYWAMAWGMKILGIPFQTNLRLFIFCVKLPCIICEFLTAGLIFKMTRKYAVEGRCALSLFLCLLNPGVLFTTGYVCQVDMLYVFFMVLTVYLLINRRLKPAYFAFAAAVLFKFQAVFITPIIAYAVINEVILNNFSWKRFFQHLAVGLSAIGMMVLSYIPFIYNFSNGEIAKGGFFSNFSSTTAGFAAACQNACNFWMLFGYNEVSQMELFGPLSCQMWGRLFIVLLLVLSSILYWKHRKDITMYPMLAALLVSGMYCFAVRMMGRYLYPALFLLFLGYACRPEKKRLICAVLFSFGYILEIGFNYLVYPWVVYHRGLVAPRIVSVFMIICFAYLVYTIWSERKDVGFEMVSGEKSIGDGAYGI